MGREGDGGAGDYIPPGTANASDEAFDEYAPPDVKRSLATYFDALSLRTSSLDTRRAYRSQLLHFQRWCDARDITKPKELTRDLLSDYMVSELARGLSPATLSLKGCTLRSFLAYLVDRGYIAKAPRVEAPRGRKRLPSVLTVDDIRRLFDACADGSMLGFRDRALIEFLYATGCRCGEVWQLNLEDLDLEARTAHVKGKGGVDRVAFLTESAAASMRTYLDSYRVPRLGSYHETAVFVSRPGRRMQRHVIWGAINHRAELAGIKKRVHPHAFRHSFATHMLVAGANLETVRRLMGHKSIASTQIYLHLDNSQLLAALDALHPLSRIPQSPTP